MESVSSNISSECFIQLNNNEPGIVGLLTHDAKHGVIIGQLADYLLYEKHSLPQEFRELIAAYVSKLNNCNFCYNSHKEIALKAADFSDSIQQIIKDILCDDNFKGLAPRYYYLLQLAKEVTLNIRPNPATIEVAREFEATDDEILRTVQIASAFCMYNRYVDGLGTVPGTPGYYRQSAEAISEFGYMAKIGK